MWQEADGCDGAGWQESVADASDASAPSDLELDMLKDRIAQIEFAHNKTSSTVKLVSETIKSTSQLLMDALQNTAGTISASVQDSQQKQADFHTRVLLEKLKADHQLFKDRFGKMQQRRKSDTRAVRPHEDTDKEEDKDQVRPEAKVKDKDT
eukprot:2722589-Pyramimonas_sp.AAC.1